MNHEKIVVDEISHTKSASFSFLMYRLVKRTCDVLISLIGILFLIPISILIKVAYVLTGDFHSIFFKQERIGLFGKRFWLYKYRTMKPNADEILVEILKNDKALREEYEENKKMKHDPRVTKAGRLVRKLSLDEFPQFINIFKGDMSLVGNRPYLPREKKDMGMYYDAIVFTKPGLTGYWQVAGEDETTFNKRLQMEAWYSHHRSLVLDIKIFLKTFLALFKGHGAGI